MPQTLFSAYFHIVFSTQGRVDLIASSIEDELFAYIGGIIRSFDVRLIGAGGTAKHLHLLISVGKNHWLPDGRPQT